MNVLPFLWALLLGWALILLYWLLLAATSRLKFMDDLLPLPSLSIWAMMRGWLVLLLAAFCIGVFITGLTSLRLK